MDEFVATCVQQQIRVFESHGEFRNDIQRFMRLAKVKDSRLVVFPELSGLMLAPPLVPGLKRTLLRVAERQVKRKPSIFDRMVGRMAGSASDMMGGIAGGLLEAFTKHADTLREAYLSIFSDIARENEMYVVSGTIYLPDPRDGQMHNTAYLFSPTGEVIGQQAKINLSVTDAVFCRPGASGLNVFETELGRLGILIGQDALLPECGRILSTLGATAVVHLVAAAGLPAFTRMKNGFAARLQENVLLGAQSCLVGKNILTQREDQADYLGRSALLAPTDMTTRYTGVLAEVGSTVTDGVVSATWDLRGLYQLRDAMELPVHRTLADSFLRQQIQAVYSDRPVPITEPAALTSALRRTEPSLELSGTDILLEPIPIEIQEPATASEMQSAQLPVESQLDASEVVEHVEQVVADDPEPVPVDEPSAVAGAAGDPVVAGITDERIWPELNEFAPLEEAPDGTTAVDQSALSEPARLPTAWEPEADVPLEQAEGKLDEELGQVGTGDTAETDLSEEIGEPQRALLVVEVPDAAESQNGDETPEPKDRGQEGTDPEQSDPEDLGSSRSQEETNEDLPRKRRWWEL